MGLFLPPSVAAHVDGLVQGSPWLAIVLKRFLEVRAIEGLVKPPSTSELLGWVRVLRAKQVSQETLESSPLRALPGQAALLKTREDHERFRA